MQSCSKQAHGKTFKAEQDMQACSKDTCIFVAEKQAQGTEGRSGKIEKTNEQFENLVILNCC